MELRHLRYFVAVAEELNFTRAALRLRTAQPSLSQQIRDLETEIGVELLARNRRSVALTEAGRVFLDEARLVLAQAERAVSSARRLARSPQRSVTLGFVPAAEVKIFPSVLTSVRAQFPQLQIVLQSLTTGEQIEALRNKTIDIGFMRLPIPDPALTGEIVLREKIVAVVPANHPCAAKPALCLADLVDTPFLQIAPKHAGELAPMIDRYMQSLNFEPMRAQKVDNVLTLMTTIGLGVGFSLLPDYAEHLVFRNVAARRLADPEQEVALAMVWRKDNMTPEVTTICDLVRQAHADQRF
jgi:LysR family transcriptional regulator, hca operon transcriptional activator